MKGLGSHSEAGTLAVLSDVHGNLEALNAVMQDMAARSVDEVFCLGDVIGYGPDPEACAQLVQQFDVVLMGQFESALQSKEAMPSLEWTVTQLSANSFEFLSGCPKDHRNARGTFAHGVLLDGEYGYLFPEDIYSSRKMSSAIVRVTTRHFCGKSHVAGVHTAEAYQSSDQLEYRYEFDGTPAIINVGSVGASRDGLASYALVENDITTFVRVDYDQTETVRKLKA